MDIVKIVIDDSSLIIFNEAYSVFARHKYVDKTFPHLIYFQIQVL